MSNKLIKEGDQLSQPEEGTVSRRDVLKVAWTTPIVLAVSPSLEVLTGSDTNFGGLTPGYWRQYDKKNKKHYETWTETDYLPDDTFDSTFGVESSFGEETTLGYTVQAKGGGENALARHATAAILNASNSNINYPYTETEVIQMVKDAYNSGDPNEIERIKDLLAEANELGVKDD